MILTDKIKVLISFKESKLLEYLKVKRKLHPPTYSWSIEIQFEQTLTKTTG
jgi:hypothetical protein